ncbi:MAG: mechanosensitive ion channel family protein [Dehalococcoidia bacterium]|nr:mechanosensitive ion channel family protein [Dehalococcoidia bacterium]
MHIDLKDIDPWVRYCMSGGIFLACFGFAFASRWIITEVVGVVAKRSKTVLDDLLIQALKTPIFLSFIALGLWLALAQSTEHDPDIEQAFVAVYIAIVAMALTGTSRALLTWYGIEVAARTNTSIDDKLLPILRKVATFLIYAIAFMIILDRLNINISPFIASMGIGGLAIALALQSTLTNLLAGSYVAADGVIKKGHYIMLENGPEGYVESISWRSTKLRHWQGNIIVMPNSKLAEAVVTDYEVPDAAMLFGISCGVNYASDLVKVERVALEVAREVMQKMPEGAKDAEPLVRFKEFGDSNINFSIILKARDRVSQFPLKSEFIKALNKRFAEEGIDIQYPARKIYFAQN